jgi:hypothetical protein
MEAKGYGVFITKTLDGQENDIPANLLGLEDILLNKFKPWEDVLEFKSDVDQAALVAPLFPPSAIMYAWKDHPSWIPTSVKEANDFQVRQPVSASMQTQPTVSAWGRKQPPAFTPPKAPAFTPVEAMPTYDEELPMDEYLDDTSIPDTDNVAIDTPPVTEDAKIAQAREKLQKANKARNAAK